MISRPSGHEIAHLKFSLMDGSALPIINVDGDCAVALRPGSKWKIAMDGLKPLYLKELPPAVIDGYAVIKFSVWKSQFPWRTGIFVPHHDVDIASDDGLAFHDLVKFKVD